MSRIIECDHCKKKMYADSRTDKRDRNKIEITRGSELFQLDLCGDCFEKMMKEFFEWNEEDFE